MLMKKVFWILTVLFFFNACSSFQKLQPKQENPDCKTSISGSLHYNFRGNNKDTILILKRNLSDLLLKGRIIEKTSEGFIFDPDKRNEHDEQTKLYKFDDIKYIIGLNGNLIFGAFPDSMEYDSLSLKITISKVDSTVIKPFPLSMVINSNESFSYCIEPGLYRIREIVITGFHHYSLILPEITFEVTKGYDNYLGDIYLDSLISGIDVHLIKFEYKKPIGKSSRKAEIKNRIPLGFSLQTWLDDNYLGIHSIFIKDEYSESANKKKSLIKIEK